jgi:Tfp pilus assembly protein PilV
MPWRRTDRVSDDMERPPASAGYSLISVLVAIILLVVGVLSLSNVLTQSLEMQTVISVRTTAVYIAQTYMEELRSRDPLTLAAEAAVRVDDQGAADASGIFTREVLVDSAGRNLIQVQVVVTNPRSSPVRLVTWMYDGAF